VVVVGPDAGAVVGGPWPGRAVGVAREVGGPATVVAGVLGATASAEGTVAGPCGTGTGVPRTAVDAGGD